MKHTPRAAAGKLAIAGLLSVSVMAPTIAAPQGVVWAAASTNTVKSNMTYDEANAKYILEHLAELASSAVSGKGDAAATVTDGVITVTKSSEFNGGNVADVLGLSGVTGTGKNPFIGALQSAQSEGLKSVTVDNSSDSAQNSWVYDAYSKALGRATTSNLGTSSMSAATMSAVMNSLYHIAIGDADYVIPDEAKAFFQSTEGGFSGTTAGDFIVKALNDNDSDGSDAAAYLQYLKDKTKAAAEDENATDAQRLAAIKLYADEAAEQRKAADAALANSNNDDALTAMQNAADLAKKAEDLYKAMSDAELKATAKPYVAEAYAQAYYAAEAIKEANSNYASISDATEKQNAIKAFIAGRDGAEEYKAKAEEYGYDFTKAAAYDDAANKADDAKSEAEEAQKTADESKDPADYVTAAQKWQAVAEAERDATKAAIDANKGVTVAKEHAKASTDAAKKAQAAYEAVLKADGATDQQKAAAKEAATKAWAAAKEAWEAIKTAFPDETDAQGKIDEATQGGKDVEGLEAKVEADKKYDEAVQAAEEAKTAAEDAQKTADESKDPADYVTAAQKWQAVAEAERDATKAAIDANKGVDVAKEHAQASTDAAKKAEAAYKAVLESDSATAEQKAAAKEAATKAWEAAQAAWEAIKEAFPNDADAQGKIDEAQQGITRVEGLEAAVEAEKNNNQG
ncbi:MAG: hypothetical protein Q3972_06435, partial [Corynebacterium sp.]|nr:hypothetical protein [Corynebacterium sp.]